MALIVPDAIPSKASSGEKRLFKILRDELPDDCHVWYEPNINKLYPDFIILGPTLGLLILEVKAWKASQILRASDPNFKIKRMNGRIETQQSPLRQGKGYRDTLLNKLKSYSILCQDEEDYQGKLAFPIGFGAIMTNISEAKARNENIYSILEKPQVVYTDELLEWDGIGERALMKRLEDMFTVRFKFMGLEDDQISTIKGVIHPEVVVNKEPATIKSVPSGFTLKPDATVIKTLDNKQEQLARSLGHGHRLFCGVVGSGKTIILLSRAKYLAGENFNKRVLILCFNKTLAAYLRSLIEEENNPLYQERIRVIHFHAWAKSIMGRLPNFKDYNSEEESNEVLADLLLEALSDIPTEEKWDAVLVDEAHTFYPNWFRCCKEALKDPDNGDLLIVSDKSQSIYKRQKFTWKSVGIKAKGRVKKLKDNYRNTKEILSAAWDLVQSFSIKEDGEETFPVVKPSAALRQGKRPTLYLCESRMAEVENAIAQIQQLTTQGYQPQDIAIIYRYLKDYEKEPFSFLTQQLESGLGYYWVCKDNKNKENYSIRHPGVRLITAKSSLGLEFKAVILLWVQQFGVGDEAEARRELYVSMTRAQDILHLFGSGQFKFLKGLQECDHLDVVS
ncbi:nuclease-related domain-containing DEAD/DEAH box helicase [Moorena sp. SIO3H5]|uniref:3'-5' exonuclease n=1 Tax=Moorena sp. SIO3H5 TaxID=2607834 RepID=UPI0013B70650|nr:nuclease-related domain-containing DEAD/DEAH box helicase [Moorena sp. SIO3H5]NEO70951.1 AAA family ATPase [Moorena sp. SIO3H5]